MSHCKILYEWILNRFILFVSHIKIWHLISSSCSTDFVQLFGRQWAWCLNSWHYSAESWLDTSRRFRKTVQAVCRLTPEVVSCQVCMYFLYVLARHMLACTLWDAVFKIVMKYESINTQISWSMNTRYKHNHLVYFYISFAIFRQTGGNSYGCNHRHH